METFHSATSPLLSVPYHRHHLHSASLSLIRAFSTTTAAPQRETNLKKRVGVTRMGLALAFGNEVNHYYEKLSQIFKEIVSWEESSSLLSDNYFPATGGRGGHGRTREN